MSEARYPYVHVDVSPDEVDLLSAQLFELGALGIEERDASTLLRHSGAEGSTLVASFPDEAAAQAALGELEPRHVARIEHVVGDAWRDGWRKYWKPMRVGERLVVKPSWEPFAAQPQDVVITLDPGQAFGTGTHESTQLLLATLQEVKLNGLHVLDVGTGSGILAIACLLLGAERADAIDNDPLAVSAARENAEANAVTARLFASERSLSEITGEYPLVLANIEARVLIPLAAQLDACVADGGSLLLSGLLQTDVDAVRAAYPALHERARPMCGDWCALWLEKRR
jgi:ribosomal protein L11 methyltransferase